MYKQCKTERTAGRQRAFETGLLEIMKTKPYGEITVIDICDSLQIQRKSFYRYFSSKDGALNALLDHTIMDYESFRTLETNAQSPTLLCEMTQFFLFWQEQKPLLDALARSNLSPALVERAILLATEDTLTSKRFLSQDRMHGRKYADLFCTSGLMSVILAWHKDGYVPAAEEMAAATAKFISEPLLPHLHDKI